MTIDKTFLQNEVNNIKNQLAKLQRQVATAEGALNMLQQLVVLAEQPDPPAETMIN